MQIGLSGKIELTELTSVRWDKAFKMMVACNTLGHAVRFFFLGTLGVCLAL